MDAKIQALEQMIAFAKNIIAEQRKKTDEQPAEDGAIVEETSIDVDPVDEPPPLDLEDEAPADDDEPDITILKAGRIGGLPKRPGKMPVPKKRFGG